MIANWAGGFGTCPMLPIPPGFVGNVVFQSVGLAAGLEFSTPFTLEIF
jgi:hypothetical protein